MKLSLLLDSLDQTNNQNAAPCPGCGVNPSVDCGFGYRDYYGDFDCLSPDTEDITCDECPHILCDNCKKEYEQRSENKEKVTNKEYLK